MADVLESYLKSRLKELRQKAPKGSVWVHTSTGKHFEVVDYVLLQATGEVGLIYKKLGAAPENIPSVRSERKFFNNKDFERVQDPE